MEVILQEDFPALGYVGDRVTVRRGYARNFLVPRGIAVEISSVRARQVNHQMNQILAKKRKLKTKAEEFANRLSDVRLAFVLKVGEKGRSFGSITSKDVHEALAQAGHAVERKQVRLLEPIKMVGAYKVTVKLHSEVSAEITVDVTAGAPTKGSKNKSADGEGVDASVDDSDRTFAEALAEEDEQRTDSSEEGYDDDRSQDDAEEFESDSE